MLLFHLVPPFLVSFFLSFGGSLSSNFCYHQSVQVQSCMGLVAEAASLAGGSHTLRVIGELRCQTCEAWGQDGGPVGREAHIRTHRSLCPERLESRW